MTGENYQPINRSDTLGFSARIFAIATLATAAGLACNNAGETASSIAPTPDKATVLTLEEMGADASVTPELKVPKVFKCGLECITPEDLQKLHAEGLTVDPDTLQIVPLPTPKIFQCDVRCIGPAAAETETPQVKK